MSKPYDLRKNNDILVLIPTGQDNARHATEIAAQLGIKNRELRRHIELLRRQGAVIIGNESGYYRPKTLSEIESYVHQEEQRAKSILFTLRSAKRLRRRLLREAAAESIHIFDDIV